jgi:hypothetical protein
MQMLGTYRYYNCILILVALINFATGYQGSEAADTMPGSATAFALLLRIIDTIPQPYAGIHHLTRVYDDTSVAVLIESVHGFDLTDSDSIRFFISEGDFETYERNLISPAVRVVEVDNGSSPMNLVWAVYDRSLDPILPPFYGLDTIVQIFVEVEDKYGNRIITSKSRFEFKIESDSAQANAFDHLPESVSFRIDNSFENYDSGIEIVNGPLTGASILYSADEPILPAFGPTDEIEPAASAGKQAVGIPLNLMPHTVFNNPVRLNIPFPSGTDVTELDIYYHNGLHWLAACDAAGNILPGGEGWMVPGSRVNHPENTPPSTEIEVYHFSAAQAVISGDSTTTGNENRDNHGSGAVVYFSCFIDTAAKEKKSLLSWPDSLGLVACCMLFVGQLRWRRMRAG